MYHPFSVTETISIAWHILRKNFATIAVYTLLAFLIAGGSFFLLDFLIEDIVLAYIAGFAILILISFIFLGFNKLIFQLIDKEYYDFEFKDIMPKVKMLLSYNILLIIVGTFAFFTTRTINTLHDGQVKYLLGIFSAIIVEIFFLFCFPICTCFIVDDESGPFESVTQSFQLIKGSFLKYFLLFLFIETLVLIGSFTIIGMVFVIPFVNIILVVAYRKLVYSHQDVDDEIAETL